MLSYLEQLRYSPTAALMPGTVYASVPHIAKIVKLSSTQVRKRLKLGVGGRKSPAKRKLGPASKLTGQHVQYLVSPVTLQRWAAKMVDERVVLFHRQFGEAQITKATLYKVYGRHNISRKSFRYVKTLNIKNLHLRDAEVAQLKASLAEARS